MFPITHIWFAEKVMGFRDNSLILGAIFPDIVISGCLDYKQTHYCGFGLYNDLVESNQTFAKAMITHTVDPKGLDYYGDENYKSGNKGYCFQKGQLIVDQVIDACNIPEGFGLWKAHNFIEMGIELNIIDNQQILLSDLHRAFQDYAAIEQAAWLIEDYYTLRRNEIVESYKKFSQYIELDKSDCHTMAAKYNLQMQSKHSISIDVEKTAEIIDRCRSLIKSDFQEFIQYCSINVKNMLDKSH
ncbi:MAG: hypothetical protein A2Y23_12200 [Clostridiales bacterium GWB2_37_7]|nr:MAG: hypothetical protein A2Y23_12200 [Clostridiales bacterium GWB2_37_7]